MWALVGIRNVNRRVSGIRSAILGLFLLAVIAIPAVAQETDIGWPRTVQSDGEKIEIYQPQVDKWEGGKLEGRAAIVVSERGGGQSVYGVVWLSARTTLDQDKRLVTLYDIDVTKASFPSARTQESSYVAKVTQSLTQWNMTIALDRLLADLAITQTEGKARGEALSTAPPKIYVRQGPSVLILIDGQPRLQKVQETNLMRVINSPAVLVLETDTGNYFLQGDGYWMTASSLQGVWSKATNPPASLATVVELEATPEGENASGTAPGPSNVPSEVIVSTEPAELVQLNGEAQFSPINGTQLLYVKNTDSDLFMRLPDQRYYVLLSGRWFSAPSFDGPWTLIAGSALPADFSRIPGGNPKAAVLASVPGTPQARDAVVAAQVPQTATVDRKKAKFTATYDGEPQFKPIEGTDMSYAANSPNDIISVGGKYYAVSDGVWFVSDSPLGPWTVCDFVPPKIYSIPPTSPLYHVRYVYVYDSTPNFVYVGYTPGYFGSFVWDGVVVFGTGFWYPCWATDFWYGCPWTWGFGWHYAYWGGGFFWRPWHPNRWYWHPWRHEGVSQSWWNRRVLYNRSPEGAVGRIAPRNVSAYDRWQGPAVVSHHPVSLRPPGRIGAPPRFTPPPSQRRDLYGGRDGQVYEHRNDGWYQRNNQNWDKVKPAPLQPQSRPQSPSLAAPRSTIQELDRQRQSRIQGQHRAGQSPGLRPSVPSTPRSGSSPSGGGRPGRH
jgi:hypothetical protein